MSDASTTRERALVAAGEELAALLHHPSADVLMALLPPRQSIALSRLEPYGFFIVMALVMTGLLTKFWLSPLVGLGYDAVRAILTPFVSLLN